MRKMGAEKSCYPFENRFSSICFGYKKKITARFILAEFIAMRLRLQLLHVFIYAIGCQESITAAEGTQRLKEGPNKRRMLAWAAVGHIFLTTGSYVSTSFVSQLPMNELFTRDSCIEIISA